MKKKKTIAWEKWEDFDYESTDSLIQEFDNLDQDEEENVGEFKIIPLISRTPIGNFSPGEPFNPTKMFDCWIMHSNFDITQKESMILDIIDGIECFKIMSRYRIFIGIGKLFSFRDVRLSIESAFGIISGELSNLLNQIDGKKKWAIAFYEDGTHEVISSENEEDEDYNNLLLNIQEKKPVNVISSDDF